MFKIGNINWKKPLKTISGNKVVILRMAVKVAGQDSPRILALLTRTGGTQYVEYYRKDGTPYSRADRFHVSVQHPDTIINS